MEEERNAKSANPSIDAQVGHRIGTAAWLSTNLDPIGDSPDLPAQSESKTPHETSRFQTPDRETHATDNAVLKDLLRLVQHLSARLENESKVSADREKQDRSRFATIPTALPVPDGLFAVSAQATEPTATLVDSTPRAAVQFTHLVTTPTAFSRSAVILQLQLAHLYIHRRLRHPLCSCISSQFFTIF